MVLLTVQIGDERRVYVALIAVESRDAPEGADAVAQITRGRVFPVHEPETERLALMAR